jgi:hypothetical protein
VALNYFNNLFKANSSTHDPILSLIDPKITQEDNDRLGDANYKRGVERSIVSDAPR